MATEVRERAFEVESSGSAAHEQTIQRYRDYVTTSFVAAIEPVAVGKAEGATVWDQDGTEYVDCFAGISVVNAGHRHPLLPRTVSRYPLHNREQSAQDARWAIPAGDRLRPRALCLSQPVRRRR